MVCAVTLSHGQTSVKQFIWKVGTDGKAIPYYQNGKNINLDSAGIYSKHQIDSIMSSLDTTDYITTHYHVDSIANTRIRYSDTLRTGKVPTYTYTDSMYVAWHDTNTTIATKSETIQFLFWSGGTNSTNSSAHRYSAFGDANLQSSSQTTPVPAECVVKNMRVSVGYQSGQLDSAIVIGLSVNDIEDKLYVRVVNPSNLIITPLQFSDTTRTVQLYTGDRIGLVFHPSAQSRTINQINISFMLKFSE